MSDNSHSYLRDNTHSGRGEHIVYTERATTTTTYDHDGNVLDKDVTRSPHGTEPNVIEGSHLNDPGVLGTDFGRGAGHANTRDSGAGKPTVADRISGQSQMAGGKLTSDPNKFYRGQDRAAGLEGSLRK
ncbi:hypothetical protein FA15DRAFT_753123 [Coprinopsis marcescibilis]|uniref:Uncharacterized protein n=1 Tax=Coprinopsis marcescibilis TaxID=230819 RepID=A0A5C3L8A9_COPMA|nr:hypothetical protein FA15DRAFT_753123 [Coprinopsis marcescibilis]